MLENTPPSPPPLDASAAAAVKRYVHPHRKNSLSRRKSGERFDRANNVYGNDGERNAQALHGIARSGGDVGGGSGGLSKENSNPARLIGLEGCCRSQASQVLNARWEAVMRLYNDVSVDLSERPIMFSGSNASAWGHFKLPHQLMSPANNVGSSTGSQMDFLSELHRAIHNANASSNN